jgi:hypothetical protein
LRAQKRHVGHRRAIDPIRLVVAQHPEDSATYYERMLAELDRDHRPAALEREDGEPGKPS